MKIGNPTNVQTGVENYVEVEKETIDKSEPQK